MPRTNCEACARIEDADLQITGASWTQGTSSPAEWVSANMHATITLEGGRVFTGHVHGYLERRKGD